MPSPYDYASGSGYARTRADWVDFPLTTTPITAAQIDQFDQAIADLKDVVKNVKDYGAVGDGTTNDFSAVQAAYDDVPDGGTLFLPVGNYKCNSQLVFNRRVNIVGCGVGSAITVNVGTSTDGIVVGTTTLLYYVQARDFCVLGAANSCRHGIVFRNLVSSEVRNVIVEAGTVAATGYGASVEGCMISRFRIIVSNNSALPYSGTISVNGIRGVGSAAAPCNANVFDCVVEGPTGDGLVIDGTVGTAGSFNNYVMGTYEGITGWAVKLTSCTDTTVRDLHLESSDGMLLTNCTRVGLGPGIHDADGTLQIVTSNDVVFHGPARLQDLNIDSGSRVKIPDALVYLGTVTDASVLPTVASAATITANPAFIYSGYEVVEVTGTTTITSVTAGWAGQVVTFVFRGILTFTNGSNLKLGSNFVTSADDTITLVCDGTNWYEVARKAN